MLLAPLALAGVFILQVGTLMVSASPMMSRQGLVLGLLRIPSSLLLLTGAIDEAFSDGKHELGVRQAGTLLFFPVIVVFLC